MPLILLIWGTFARGLDYVINVRFCKGVLRFIHSLFTSSAGHLKFTGVKYYKALKTLHLSLFCNEGILARGHTLEIQLKLLPKCLSHSPLFICVPGSRTVSVPGGED